MQQLGTRPNPLDMAVDVADRQSSVALNRPVYELAKRAFDILFALVLILIVAPVWLVVALAIRLTSPGPVLYRQIRVGKDGRNFRCWKFRTMMANADALITESEDLAGEYRRAWKLADDPRITPVGRWLRKSSIDELPQLLNILRGEMSVVGPRPVQPQELEDQFGELGRVVTSVPPGLTSLWSVSGRSLLTYEERIALEVDYVRRRSFGLDLLVILWTIPAIITGRGAM